MERTVEEIGAKMDALGLWGTIAKGNFAVKPRGTAFPYFCTALIGDGEPVKARFLMLEGWRTLHDFVRLRMDRDFGFYSTPAEMPHFELVVLKTGEVRLFRHDPGYVPVLASPTGRALARRILWEAYGVMLRLESDNRLPFKFAAEKAVFARVESAAGVWGDAPLEICEAAPHFERVTFDKATLAKATDLPIAQGTVLELDFLLIPEMMTKEPRARCVYGLLAIDSATGERAMDSHTSVHPEAGLRGMWESLPLKVLQEFVRRGKIPAEVRVRSGRVFRLLRPLCSELSFKLSLHDSLPQLESALKIWYNLGNGK